MSKFGIAISYKLNVNYTKMDQILWNVVYCDLVLLLNIV